MSSGRAGGGPGSAAIPANARKTVQSLKEIVPNGEDEIYSVLKECNMDPDETVQRLLNQDPFHEVKRKRDKKKEWNKAGTDSRLRPASGVTQAKGGRAGMSERGSGRGGGFSRHPSSDFAAGRARSFSTKENGGVNTAFRVARTSGVSSSVVPSSGQRKPLISAVSSQPGPEATVAPSAGLLNGIPSYIRSTSVPQGSWGAAASGHTTMADIVKANGTPLPPSGLTAAPVTNAVTAPVSTSTSQQYIIPGTVPTPISSGVYSSSTDSVLDPSRDLRATGASGATKREIGTVGNQRTKGEWSNSSPLTMDSLSAPSITSQSLQSAPTSASSPVAVAGPDRDTEAVRPSSPSASPLPPTLQEQPSSHPVADTSNSSVGAQARHGTVTASSGLSASRTPVIGGPFSRPGYLSQQHPVGTQKATGAGLEWKPKVVLQSPGIVGAVNTPLSEAVTPSAPASVSGDSGMVTAASKLKALSIHEDQPASIPEHGQVAESEQTHLSFGSFAADFGTSFSASFVSEDSSKANISIAESTTVIETPIIESSSTSSAVITVPAALSQSYVHQSISTPEEVSVVSNEASRVSLPPPPAVLQSDAPKLDPVAHQGPHYPYLPAIPNYGGFNVMQQVPLSQYAYETSETQPPDTTRLPSLVPYTDPTPSFYTPLYRPGSDGDARYPFVTSNTSNKYNGNMGLVNLTGQNLPSQESGNAIVPPVPAAQTSQTGNGQTGAPVPQQQPLPLHAYAGQPAGAPLGHHFANVFGYQYIQPSYAYMHSHPPPYQHNYTASSVYPQGPTGGNYPTAAASTYSPGGVTAVKYPLSQFKPGSATGMGPHSVAATGYGGYSSAQTGYAANPSVTVGSTTGYDDAAGIQQYKDNIYIPNQQVEGSTVWIQAQLSRDMAPGGMQTSSYYNIPTQGQHGTYPHAQQPSHAHTHPGAYASLYHPSQSGQAPTTHQLLQQAQALGAGGGSQGGSYQQPQRTQQTWANNY